MNIDNDEKIIKNALNTIYTKDSEIHSNVKRRINHRKKKPFRKAIVGGCIAALSALICVPVMADKIPSFKNLILSIHNGFESMIQPVELVSIDNGIKMEVVGAMNDSEMAVVYITLQDLEEDRIDETIDLYDSYNLTGGRSFTSEVVNYDESSKTATIRIQVNGGKKLSGKELEFSFREFISGKKVIDTPIDKSILLDNMEDNKNKVSLDMNNISGGGGNIFQEYQKVGEMELLKPGEKNISIPNVDFMHISNMGIIDGRLHIQTKWSEEGFDNHGYFYFVDELGNEVQIEQGNVYFGMDHNGETTYGREYVEYIYDINELNLSNIDLNAYMVSSKNHVEGNWKARFEIEPVKEKKLKCSIEVGQGTIDKVVVSPLGVALETKGNEANIPSVEITMDDGRKESIAQSVGYTDNKNGNIKFISTSPLDITKIKYISIGGNIIPVDFNE